MGPGPQGIPGQPGFRGPVGPPGLPARVHGVVDEIATSCDSYYLAGHRTSGIYTIKPTRFSPSFEVFCDMESAGGGWTLVASIHENNIDGKCTSGDKWSSEDGAQSSKRSKYFMKKDARVTYQEAADFCARSDGNVVWFQNELDRKRITDWVWNEWRKAGVTGNDLNSGKGFWTSMVWQNGIVVGPNGQQGYVKWHANHQPSPANRMADVGWRPSWMSTSQHPGSQLPLHILHSMRKDKTSDEYGNWVSHQLEQAYAVCQTDADEGDENNSESRNWSNSNVFGNVEAATSSDYKSPAFNNLLGSDVMVWHVPNDTPASEWSSQATLKYYTDNQFLANYGGTLQSVYRKYVPMKVDDIEGQHQNSTEAQCSRVNSTVSAPVTFLVGSNEQVLEGIPPQQSDLVTPGYIQFGAFDDNGVPNALCSGFKTRGCRPSSVCIGGINTFIAPDGDEDACGDFAGAGSAEQPAPSQPINDILSSVLLFARPSKPKEN